MRRLVLVHTTWGYQHGSHHGKRSTGRGYHIAHHISVVILAGPDKTALCLHNTCYRIVDQGIEILDTCRLKFILVLLVINLLENILKIMVILFRNGILGGKPQILFCIQRITKTRFGKAGDGLVRVVDSLEDSRTVKFVNGLADLCAILCCKYKFCLTFSRHLDLCIFIYIAVGMSGEGDRRRPVFHTGIDALYLDRGTENRAVQSCPDRTIWAFPHLFQIVLCHSCRIWGNGRTFYSHTIFFCRLRRIHCHLIIGLVPVLQTEVIILRL